MELYAFVTNLA